MASSSLDFKINDLKTSVLKVNVEFTKRFKVRVFIALSLFKLASFILGNQIKIKYDN